MEDKNLSKHIPNWITALRLAGAAGLLLCRPLSAGFFVMYILCGLSDGLDGAAARKWNAATPAGAAFDSAADAAFAASALWVLLPLLRMQTWMLIWLAGIALLRTVSVTVGVDPIPRFRLSAYMVEQGGGAAAVWFSGAVGVFGYDVHGSFTRRYGEPVRRGGAGDSPDGGQARQRQKIRFRTVRSAAGG